MVWVVQCPQDERKCCVCGGHCDIASEYSNDGHLTQPQIIQQLISYAREQQHNSRAGCIYCTDTLDKGRIHMQGGRDWALLRFHHTTQDDLQFETFELFVFRIFHLIFWKRGWFQVTETLENKTANMDNCCSWRWRKLAKHQVKEGGGRRSSLVSCGSSVSHVQHGP